MNGLHQIVSGLFASKMVSLVIGYEKGSGGKCRPSFVYKTEDIERLVFDETCTHNLSSYLTKTEYKSLDNIGLFATLPAIRSIIRLSGENQFQGKNFTFIIVSTDKDFEAITGIDALIKYSDEREIIYSPDKKELLAKIDAMTREERFAYWKDQLSACIKCYACRAACPMCYCTRCTVEINQPQWISVPSTLLGNFEWHIMRVMHMAGRCVDCSACESACPLNIPVNIITRRLIKDIEANFGPDIPGADNKNILNTFHPDDKENFIQ
jgi:ferredoxin